MKKPHTFISRTLYGKPWAILEAQYFNIHTTYQNYLKGRLSASSLDLDDDLDDDSANVAPYTLQGKVAIVSLGGVILKHASMIETLCGAVDVDSFLVNVQKAFADPNVESILLDINSPGGEVTGVMEAADAIREMCKTKQIVAFTDSLCASAAYWIASACDAIFVTATSDIGSIGCYIGMYDYSIAFSQEGVKPVLIKSGKFKGDGFQGLPISEDTIARLQAEVDQTNLLFRDAIAIKRKGLSDDDMQGQCFLGLNAIQNGISDGIVKNINELVSILND
jgi:ClpP class serine protease